MMNRRGYYINTHKYGSDYISLWLSDDDVITILPSYRHRNDVTDVFNRFEGNYLGSIEIQYARRFNEGTAIGGAIRYSKMGYVLDVGDYIDIDNNWYVHESKDASKLEWLVSIDWVDKDLKFNGHLYNANLGLTLGNRRNIYWSYEDDPYNELQQDRYLESEDISHVLETLKSRGLLRG